MKRIVIAIVFTLPALFAVAQDKGKNKIKTKKKPESSVPVTVPSPGDQSKQPEVKPKEKPQIYQPQDTAKKQQSSSVSTDPADSRQQPVIPGDTKTPESAGNPSSAADGKPASQQQPPSGNSSVFTDDDMKKQKEEKRKKEKDWKQNGAGNHKEKGDGHWKDKDGDHGKGKGNVMERKNIPAQVSQAFEKDFPGVQKSVWTKNQDNWTAEFTYNGVRQRVTYKSNGERIHLDGT